MGEFVTGQVVVLPFPHSNLKKQPARPALVLATDGNFNDLIVCMITARQFPDAIEITEADFLDGRPHRSKSYVRPDRLLTVEPTLIIRRVGTLKPAKVKEILDQMYRIFNLGDLWDF